MELKKREIPLRFLEALPEGIKLVKRHGHQYLVVEEVTDHSGNSLINQTVNIHGEPSIKMEIEIGGSRGLIFVDAYWGSHAKLFSFLPPRQGKGEMVTAFSPVTGESLMADWSCGEEGCESSRGIKLNLSGGQNYIYVCARLGCPGHEMAVNQLSHKITNQISRINYFGAGDDEIFQGI
jgi:hypothetical protein